MVSRLVFVATLCSLAFGQYQGGNYAPQNQLTTPYPRNYHPPAPVHYVNIGAELAGDYKFGYDTGKGPLGQSFREETRLPDGTVKGAYGYLDEQGKQRIVKYTAGKTGFSAEGDVGPAGAPRAVAPGPAPQPAAVHTAPAAQAYRPPPQQAPAQHYNPPAQQYRPPPQQSYRPQGQYRNDGQYDPNMDYYDNGPAYIDVERLSYNIGTANQG